MSARRGRRGGSSDTDAAKYVHVTDVVSLAVQTFSGHTLHTDNVTRRPGFLFNPNFTLLSLLLF